MFRMTNKRRRLIAGIIGGVLAVVMILGTVAGALIS